MTGQLKNILRHNKLQKFIALVLATALWFFVMSSQNPVINSSYTVPIAVINAPRDYSVTLEDTPIKVKLSAPRSYFVDYSDRDIRATVDVANLAAGDYDLTVEVNYPKGFELRDISPEKLHVKLEPFLEKQMNAEVIVNGSTVSDAVVKGIAKSLDSITVIGARNDVEKVQRVIGYVGLTNNEDDFDLQVPMSAIDSDGREVKGVKVVPSFITVSVDLETGVQKKTVPVKVNLIAPSGKEFAKITVNPEQIEIAGKEEIINSITEIETVMLTLPALNDDFHGTLKLVLPKDIVVQQDRVTVTAVLKR